MNSRRDFIRQLGCLTAATQLRLGPARLFDENQVADDLELGYAAITWGGDDDRAIEDISALGFPGIQLRANAVQRFGKNPTALRDLLASHHLKFVALSSGNVSIDPAREAQVIQEHVDHARFLRDAGGMYLQLIDERPRGRPIESSDYTRLGRLLTEIGKRTADVGIPAAYHHHVGSLGEKPDEIQRVLDAADAKYVRLLLDIAHYQAGGGDPVAAVRRYADRILFLHIKDVRIPAPGRAPPSFEFVELGQGQVDLRGVFAALREVHFKGWGIVELDSVPQHARTPKESAMMSKRYLEDVLRVHV
jgi:inosose dehydratase